MSDYYHDDDEKFAPKHVTDALHIDLTAPSPASNNISAHSCFDPHCSHGSTHLERTSVVPRAEVSIEDQPLRAEGDLALRVIVRNGEIVRVDVLSPDTPTPDGTYVMRSAPIAKQSSTKELTPLQRLNALACDLGDRRDWEGLTALEAEIQELRERPIDNPATDLDVQRLLKRYED